MPPMDQRLVMHDYSSPYVDNNTNSSDRRQDRTFVLKHPIPPVVVKDLPADKINL